MERLDGFVAVLVSPCLLRPKLIVVHHVASRESALASKQTHVLAAAFLKVLFGKSAMVDP